jgi:hypothetical protein
MQEWLNWPLSKSGEPKGSEGSNPSLSAKKKDVHSDILFLGGGAISDLGSPSHITLSL